MGGGHCKPPATKFASQGDAQGRADTQIKFLYYPLITLFKTITNEAKVSS